MPSIFDRFENAIMPLTECGCWIWMRARTTRGYGSVKIDGMVLRAHRVSWQISNGPIPEGLHVLHQCDVTCCVNPDHLFLGNHSDNMQDKERKGRGNHATGLRNARYTKPESTCRGDRHWTRLTPDATKGENNNRAILTTGDVELIRGSDLSGAELGRRFGITKTHANRIKRGAAWSHL